MKRVTRSEDWDRWAVVGEPYNGPTERPGYSIGTGYERIVKSGKAKKFARIGFRPPQEKR